MARDETPLAPGAVTGADFDRDMCRFATMNYLLSTGERFDSPAPVQVRNSLAEPEKGTPTVIVCNPPFRSTAPLPEGRIDLWARSGEHATQLPPAHRAQPADRRTCCGVCAGQHTLRGRPPKPPSVSRLLQEYDVHTLLRLPTGVFARGGVKTNVIFFDAVRPPRRRKPGDQSRVDLRFQERPAFCCPGRDRCVDPILRTSSVVTVTGSREQNRAATDRFRPVSYEQLAEQAVQPRHPLAGRDRSRSWS